MGGVLTFFSIEINLLLLHDQPPLGEHEFALMRLVPLLDFHTDLADCCLGNQRPALLPCE